MRISDRLQALTFFVPYNSKVIDVGTDHALLPTKSFSTKYIDNNA